MCIFSRLVSTSYRWNAEKKRASSEYLNKKCGLPERDIGVGDLVLVGQDKVNYLSSCHGQDPHEILARHGNQLQFKSKEGVVYYRNIHTSY